MKKMLRRVARATPGYAAIRSVVRGSSAKLRDIDGFQMYLDVNDRGLGRSLYKHGERELCFMHILNTELEEGMIAADLGANIGYTTLYMCRGVGAEGSVFAFEPDPRVRPLLTKNIDANGFGDTTRIFPMAISNSQGEAMFNIASAQNLGSLGQTVQTIRRIPVKTETLTTFFGNRNIVPNILKMDVEGHEVEILDGGFELFANSDETVKILMEVHPKMYSEEHSLATQLERYLEIGFRVKYVVSTPVAQPRLFRELGYSPTLTIPTDGRIRAIYDKISDSDAIRLACFPHEETTPTETSQKIVRSIMIERSG